MKFLFNHTRNIILFLLFLVLLFTRFVGIDWGLPFPMHPDERNMVIAITQLQCEEFGTTECFNPHFFAYGQFPLYIAYILAPFISLVYKGTSFEHAALALRLLSALASVATVIMLVKTVKQIVVHTYAWLYFSLPFFTFVPGFIQFAHFGTTESLMMLFYVILLYFSVKLLTNQTPLSSYIRNSAIVFGISLGTKVSALAFGAIPAVALVLYLIQKKDLQVFFQIMFEGAKFLIIAAAFFIITSPYNMIAYDEFVSSMQYESAVGLGEYKAFYTRQFEYTMPFIFQFVSIFPYSLGWPIFSLFILGFVFLPYKSTYIFLRLQFLLFFIPNSLFYAKWARFSSPIFPLMTLIAFLMFIHFYKYISKYLQSFQISTVIVGIFLFVSLIPGMAYLTIYASQDVRFEASEWVLKNIPENSYILSETANVVDIPIIRPEDEESQRLMKPYTYISFNFYDLHLLDNLSPELEDHIAKADYIFIPSRRVFANHTCYFPEETHTMKHETSFITYEDNRCELLRQEYPEVYSYYDRLFSGQLGFEKVAEFTSYPRIELFGRTIFELPDEQAEETWTVFDHPVIRIYKRT